MTTTILDRATDPSSVADTPAGTTPLAGADFPDRDYFPNADAPLVLLDAHLLFTRPPAGAETLADVVRRVAG